jgi:hypothetical protein
MQFFIWQLRLARDRFARYVAIHEAHATMRSWLSNDSRRSHFVDRVSPWDKGVGYRRQPLRTLLYRLLYPRLFARRWFWLALHKRFRLNFMFGKFEALNEEVARKVEWLWYSELETESMGDLSEGDLQHSRIFDEVDVPWARFPETWIIGEDQQGFVTALQYDDEPGRAWLDWNEEKLAIERSHAEDDDPFDGYFNQQAWDEAMGFARES